MTLSPFESSYLLKFNSQIISIILSEVCPSQRGGILPFFHWPERSFFMAGAMASGLVPSNSFVPVVTVSGRSVLFLKVMQGTPMTVVSSVMPPESVMTALLLSTR